MVDGRQWSVKVHAVGMLQIWMFEPTQMHTSSAYIPSDSVDLRFLLILQRTALIPEDVYGVRIGSTECGDSELGCRRGWH